VFSFKFRRREKRRTKGRGTVTPRPGRGRRRSQRKEHRGHRGRRRERRGIPRLRGPTRHTAARKRKSGRSARNDNGVYTLAKWGPACWTPTTEKTKARKRQPRGKPQA